MVTVHQELVARANSSPVVVMDETGWRVGGKSAWLWEATNPEMTLYWVAEGRGFEEACEVITADYDGTIAVSYTHLDVYKRQVPGRPGRQGVGQFLALQPRAFLGKSAGADGTPGRGHHGRAALPGSRAFSLHRLGPGPPRTCRPGQLVPLSLIHI